MSKVIGISARLQAVAVLGAITGLILIVIQVFYPQSDIFNYWLKSDWLIWLQSVIYWFLSPCFLKFMGYK